MFSWRISCKPVFKGSTTSKEMLCKTAIGFLVFSAAWRWFSCLLDLLGTSASCNHSQSPLINPRTPWAWATVTCCPLSKLLHQHTHRLHRRNNFASIAPTLHLQQLHQTKQKTAESNEKQWLLPPKFSNWRWREREVWTTARTWGGRIQ